jgi:feruloyl-CoA synthase
MAVAGLRPVELWRSDVAWERRGDGSVLVWQKGALPPFPERLSDRITHWAKQTPDVTWMAERGRDGTWIRVSYAELLARIRAIGQGLLDLRLGPERPHAILAGNSIAHGLMALGAQYAGIPSAAIAPAYASMPSGFGKLREVAAQITPGAVFADNVDASAAAIAAAFPGLPRLGLAGANRARDWNDLINARATSTVDAANRSTGPDTVAKFLFTSGTTGSPKAVVQTQRMLCSNMEMVRDCYTYFEKEPPVLLDWAPWNHVASGNKVFNMALYNGGTYYIDGGKPTPHLIGETIRNLRDVSPTWYFNVPVGYDMLIDAMRKDRALAESFFRNLKLMMYAGAAMAEHTWAELDRLAIEVTGKRVLLATGLGSTETAPFALFCTEPQDRPGNVGVPAKGLTLKLVPVEDRFEAHIKGPSVTPGYWRNDELTRASFDEEGFYNLGDALRFADPEDPSKGFYFDGRTAENFKMATGIWVGVGALKARLIDALQGLARDAVIAGEGRGEIGALLIPSRPAIERMTSGGAALSDTELFNHPALRSAVAKRLESCNAAAGGTSLRVARVMFMTEPLDLDRGEVTDKGSVNQRAVLRHRADLVAKLFANDPGVIVSGGA